MRSGPGDTATVVLIEDLHWIDAASEEFVEALADAVVGTATLLIVNFRIGFVASFMQRSHYRQIFMPPLAAADAQRLLREHFGDDPSLALLSRNIVERAQGIWRIGIPRARRCGRADFCSASRSWSPPVIGRAAGFQQ